MSIVKYRLKEVAADFGMTTKEISEIIAKFSEKPKSNSQVLTDVELNAVFDYLTQKNQISSLEQVFAVKPAPKAEPVPEKPADPAGQAAKKPQPGKDNSGRPQQPQQPKKPGAPAQQAAPAAQNPPAQPAKPKEPERKRERRVVDTSAVQVNANRFADVDNLVSERVQNFQGGASAAARASSSRSSSRASSRAASSATRSRRKCAGSRWRLPGRLPSP